MGRLLRESLEELAHADDARRRAIREDLHKGILDVVRSELRSLRLGEADREDIELDAAVKIGVWLEAGKVEPGREEAFARRCARHAALDRLRRARARREVPFEDVHADERGSDEARVTEIRRKRTFERRLARVHAILDVPDAPPTTGRAIPEAYRAILHAVYRERVSITTLVNRELGPAEASDVVKRRIRNKLDARLSRARRWVEEHLADVAQDEEES